MADQVLDDEIAGFPAWIKPGLSVKAGRDPLGLQTITIDRIMPQLLPGILALSQRARYFSVYPFLLAEYQERQLSPTNNALSAFIKSHEYEYGLAVQLCPRGCGSRWSAVVGKERVEPAVRSGDDPLERGESVQSYLGGYGLYYRSPLIDLQVVAPLGTQLGEERTPIDVLRKDAWVTDLARHFRDAIQETTYYTEFFRGTGRIPVAVLRDFAEVACLCRLSDFPAEQEAIRSMLFSAPADWLQDEVDQRRRSFALFLRAIATSPSAAQQEGAFRRAVVQHAWPLLTEDTPEGETSARWAALLMKEYMQEALSCIWTEVCQTGLALQRPDGMAPDELRLMLRERLLPAGPLEVAGQTVDVTPAEPSSVFASAVAEATSEADLEDIRTWAVAAQTAVAGLVLLFATLQRLPDPAELSNGWTEIGQQRSDNQPGLLILWRLVNDRLESGETLADTLEWLANRYVVQAHERIAYSKLPEFTFRFCWENSLLRFYDNGAERFALANVRRGAVMQISHDLGLWSSESGEPALSLLGERFVQEVFG